MSIEEEKKKVKRNYKDTVFRDLFTSWESPVFLYNAIFSCNVPENTKIEHLRISNALYTSMRCDLSFTIGDELVVIVEHQSTINRNMPVRFLLYIGKLYEIILDASLRYARGLKHIPTPRFMVLYNGSEPFPERDELRLSNAFIKKDVGMLPQLDLIVPVININYGNNKKILERCPTLNGYSYLDYCVKSYKEYGNDKYEMAIEDCIKNDMIKEYLKKERKRVKNMLQDEYDYETDIAVQRAEALEYGIEQGIEQGIVRGAYDAKVETAINLINFGLSLENISKATGLSLDEIKRL